LSGNDKGSMSSTSTSPMPRPSTTPKLTRFTAGILPRSGVRAPPPGRVRDWDGPSHCQPHQPTVALTGPSESTTYGVPSWYDCCLLPPDTNSLRGDA
jgi:hypothetical protein